MLFNKNMCAITQMGCTFLLSAMLYLNCLSSMTVSANIQYPYIHTHIVYTVSVCIASYTYEREWWFIEYAFLDSTA